MNALEVKRDEVRVLILAPTQRDAAMSRTLLEDAGLAACTCVDLAGICREIEHGAGAVLITEEALRPEHHGCLEALLEKQPAWSDLPILVLTRGGANSAAAAWALERLGNVILLERPVRLNTLVSTVRTAIRARERQYQIRRHLAERAKSAQELRRLNETLEQRVAERTALAERQATQLRALASALTQAEQRERRRLAQVLHDHLQQFLVAAKLHVSVLLGRPPAVDFRDSLAQVMALIDDSIAASRDLTIELSPPVLYHAGLVGALEWVKRWKFEKYALEVELDADVDAEPDSEEIRVVIFTMVRELLFNVVKHAKVKKARVETRRTDDGIRVTVSDRGAGFHLERRSRDRSDRSGYGLFSVEQRLDVIGGTLEIESAPGRGTRVTIFVPVQPSGRPKVAKAEQANGLPAAQAPAAGGPLRARSERIRVLLVDDHQIVREGIAGLLKEESDIEVVAEASDGEMAVEVARRLSPDVIVMDVDMSRLNGIEATRRITAEQPYVRVVGLSMHVEQNVARALKAAGARAYLAKGGPVEDLVAAIRANNGTT